MVTAVWSMEGTKGNIREAGVTLSQRWPGQVCDPSGELSHFIAEDLVQSRDQLCPSHQPVGREARSP